MHDGGCGDKTVGRIAVQIFKLDCEQRDDARSMPLVVPCIESGAGAGKQVCVLCWAPEYEHRLIPTQANIMPTTYIDFTSQVDRKGYTIVSVKRFPSQVGEREADWVLGAKLKDWMEARIVGVGGELRALRLRNYPFLFNKFASVQTPEELLKFVAQYGPLTPAGHAGGKGDEIRPLLSAAASMKDCFKSHGGNFPCWPMPNPNAWLSTDKAQEAVSVKVGPATLLDALWLQLGHSLAGGAQWRQCAGCGDWFPVGRKSGKRLIAKFHSDECRSKHSSVRRSRR
jgi:hypothetical protein